MSRSSDPSLPSIVPPEALGEAVPDERVERVWARLERDLPMPRPTSRKSSRALLMGTLGLLTFVGGLVVGRELARSPALLGPVATSELAPPAMVLASGSEARTFTLPSGGEATLAAESTAELVRGRDGTMLLRLLLGEATIDARTSELSILAGEAQLAAGRGARLSVRRDGDEVDVRVSGGHVRVVSPAGTRELVGGQRERFPLRSVVALVPSSDPSAAPVVGPPLARRASPTAPIVADPDWRALLHRGDSAAALAALREHPGGIMGAVGAAKSAEELLDLASVARFKGGDSAAAVRALERVVNELGGDPLAGLELSRLYEAQGRATEAQALRDKAMKGPMGELALADQIEADRRAGRLDEARRRAKEYLERFPSGMHRAQLERLLDDDDKDAPKDPKGPKGQGEQPKGSEPPKGEQPKGEQPKGEQPKGSEPPKGDPPKAAATTEKAGN